MLNLFGALKVAGSFERMAAWSSAILDAISSFCDILARCEGFVGLPPGLGSPDDFLHEARLAPPGVGSPLPAPNDDLGLEAIVKAWVSVDVSIRVQAMLVNKVR